MAWGRNFEDPVLNSQTVVAWEETAAVPSCFTFDTSAFPFPQKRLTASLRTGGLWLLYHAIGPKRKMPGVWGQRPQEVTQAPIRPTNGPRVSPIHLSAQALDSPDKMQYFASPPPVRLRLLRSARNDIPRRSRQCEERSDEALSDTRWRQCTGLS